LHLSPELALDHWLASHHTLGLVISDYYDNAHFVVTLSLLALLWWRRADLYRPLRNSLVLMNLLAFAVFWRYPVAPPRMLDGFIDVVSSTHAIGSWHSGALASHANELAAMPSLHIAWAAWCSFALSVPDELRRARHRKPLRARHSRGARDGRARGALRAPRHALEAVAHDTAAPARAEHLDPGPRGAPPARAARVPQGIIPFTQGHKC
jgi:hypothetical protein